MKLSPNRVAALLTALSGVLAAIAVPVANLDTSSTAGVIGGLFAIVVAAVTWLRGWQAHEAREELAQQVVQAKEQVPRAHP